MRPVNFSATTLPAKEPGEIARFLQVVARRFGFHPPKRWLGEEFGRERFLYEFEERVKVLFTLLSSSAEERKVEERDVLQLHLLPPEQIDLDLKVDHSPAKPACAGCPMWRRAVVRMPPRSRDRALQLEEVNELVISWSCTLARIGFAGNMRFVETLREVRSLTLWTLERWGYEVPETAHFPRAVESAIFHPRYGTMARTDGATQAEIDRTLSFLRREIHEEQSFALELAG